MRRKSELLIDMWDILHRECHRVVTEETYDALKEAIKALEQERSRSAEIKQYRHDCEKLMEENEQLKKALKQYPCEDAISRQSVIDLAKKGVLVSNRNFESVCKAINDLPSVNPQEPNTEQFSKWVASEIFDDNWEYNKDSFAEIACRKLAKLGIVKANGDEWELVRSQEGSEKE